MAHEPMKIPLSHPDISSAERQAVLDVLESPYLSFGPKLDEFERAVAKYVGVRHAVAVNSGTSALQLIVRSLGIGPGDEVITTPFSFIASSNCIVVEGARPVFVDIDAATYNLDVAAVESAITPKTKAILAVDVFGRCADWKSLRSIADRHKLALIEDSCEAIGAELNGRRAGSFGDAGCFGFYPNKQMTTGEGGVIVTDREDVAAACRNLRNQGREQGQGWLEHTRIGFNYRLSDINCALGLAQLSRLDEMLAKREVVANLYLDRLRDLEGVVVPPSVKDGRLSWFVFVVRLDDRYTRAHRDRVMLGLRSEGIGCSNYFPPIHLQPAYVERLGCKRGDFPITEHVSDRTLALPFFNALTASQVEEVTACLVRHLRLVEQTQ